MPWQYDRHTLYDGYANIYTFVKDEIKTKLARLPLKEFNEGKDECKSLEVFVTKEPLKYTTKLCMSRLIPMPPWEVGRMDYFLGLLWSLFYLQCC